MRVAERPRRSSRTTRGRRRRGAAPREYVASTRGFTLVEVLVALVVLAVGMLGMAVLLFEGLQGSRSALERTQALNLASDIAERMRANRAAGRAYDTADGTPDPRLDAACEDAASACAAPAMAGNDLRRWLDAVAATLPEGRGDVAIEPLAASAHRGRITIRWAQAGTATPATCTLLVDL